MAKKPNRKLVHVDGDNHAQLVKIQQEYRESNRPVPSIPEIMNALLRTALPSATNSKKH